ncbi:MAG: S41 family peptidase [Bacteroidota bacterium]
MKHFQVILLGIVCLLPLIESIAQSPDLSVTQVQEDYRIFRSALLDAHPGLNLYLDNTDIATLFPKELSVMDSSLRLDFYETLAFKTAAIQDGHTSLKPGKQLEAAVQTIPHLPFELEWIDDQLILTQWLAGEPVIPEFSVIQGINGISATTIMETLWSVTSADAGNQGFKVAYNNKILANQIRRHFGRPEGYTLEWISKTGETQRTRVKGASARPATNGPDYPLIQLSLEKEKNYAYLDIRTFQHKLLNEMHIQFPNYIHEAFKAIRKSDIDHLIIDLRDNVGGENIFALYLYTYLAFKDFKAMSPGQTKLGPSFSWLEFSNFPSGEIPFLSKRTSKVVDAKWTLLSGGIDSKVSYSSTSIFFDHLGKSRDIKKQKFEGHVYLLINGLTFSAASHFASLLSTREQVTFVGEAMGGAHGPSCGSGQVMLELPHSGFRLSIPFVQRQVADIDLDRGPILQPDYKVKVSLEDRKVGRDPVMEKVLELIKD